MDRPSVEQSPEQLRAVEAQRKQRKEDLDPCTTKENNTSPETKSNHTEQAVNTEKTRTAMGDNPETGLSPKDAAETIDVKNIKDKIDYLDNTRKSVEAALGNNPDKKQDLDIIRSRVSDEYKSIADTCKDAIAVREAAYDKLSAEYQKTPDNSKLTAEAASLKKEIKALSSSANYANAWAKDLSEGLDPSQRTTFSGVGGKSFTDLHKNMIQKQGEANTDFRGTCGLCSIANTLTALGNPKMSALEGSQKEGDVLQRARDSRACETHKILPFTSERKQEHLRNLNGGTTDTDITKIMNSYGYSCETKSKQSLSDIAEQLESGKGAMISVDHRVLNTGNDAVKQRHLSADHKVTVTGIEKNTEGKPVGLWIHDTGGSSTMGTAFYCSAEDYNVWKKSKDSTVQYVSKLKDGD